MNLLGFIAHIFEPVVRVIQHIVEAAVNYYPEWVASQGASHDDDHKDDDHKNEKRRNKGTHGQGLAADSSSSVNEFAGDETSKSEDDAADSDGATSDSKDIAVGEMDIAQWTLQEAMPAGLLLATAGNPVARALLQMMLYERPHLDQLMQGAQSIGQVEQKLVSIFGLAEEHTEDTTGAAHLFIAGN